jgi:hypothetical protein
MKEISPCVHECPICKRRYHSFGYDNTPVLYGDHSNLFKGQNKQGLKVETS